MAYNKLKKEQYANVGGINTKASVYVTGENQVLDLVNYDLQTIGAWSQRMGMTTALAGNTLAVGASNRYNFGFQTYRLRNEYLFGVSFSELTFIQSNSLTYSLSLSNGVLTQVYGGTLTASTGIGNVINVVAPTTDSGASTVNIIRNEAYFVSGFKTFKATALTGVHYYGLPYVNDSINSILSVSATGVGSFNGDYEARGAYVDYNGYVGVVNTLGVNLSPVNRFALSVAGANFTSNATASGANRVRVYLNNVVGFDATEFVSVGDLTAGTTLTLLATAGLIVPGSGFGEVAPNHISNFQPTGAGDGAKFYTSEACCVEIYDNRVFWGVAKGQNILFWSEVLELQQDAQNVDVDAFANIANTKYPLIGIKSFNQSLIVFLQKGVFRISGTPSTGLNLQDLNSEYGLINSRSIVAFKERLWFLDEYQIMEFNGANINDVSNPMQGYLSRMNVTAAQKTATAYHYEDRNEVWFAIPIDGSNENNIVLVFDYEVGAWYATKSTSNFTNLTRYSDQTAVQGLSSATVYQNNPRLFTGHPGGSLGYFNTAFKTDYGNAITLSFKTRYHAEQGHSVTNEWRRFYLDTGPWAGTTLSFDTSFYANFATATISLTRTIYASGSPYSGPQQTRIDFGIPAKSLSAEVKVSTGASIPIVRVYGYTIESRFLRNV